ncbi:DUF892 family protein [Dyadobacter flavalbus]|nr:DUF892 family protein [Dyadobacter flavalbus]KAA6439777.1 DUF892 family protein [Dyadobacter flavalbus]
MREHDGINVTRVDLEEFFLHYLNKIYTAKTLLVEDLPKLMNNAHFSDLREAMDHTIDEVKQQIARMDKIYEALTIVHAKIHSKGLKGLIEDSFGEIKMHSGNPELRDMSILFYLHCIESIETASFQILEMASVKIKNSQVKELIRQNYQDSKADKTLYLLISAKYIYTVN